ncbi:MAG: hypothetical protein COT91_00400 [Candidatus Doudnabacteria bacterium CG10_big_fil_rev_8_21_14_0_10_41_10]|uniref:Glycosyl transferase family 1 domain-containing protein n=1 Tax=Candidatus Doudnabacteria bacterium CG10_big_fil_rev_8_21_14_0_10_41_10 TaxID=1974551 RepID=A0A2H0VES0_9BACT|nr:MAG: hypothetical protein COT91_00400 [Candidatus Doudnabacteria bacterium CG10_big_fil_rev_8_21_14_0_10_41_10]
MKLIYIANARIPTEKAHGIQIMKTCEALVGQGVDLELWLPRRNNPDFEEKDIFEFYEVKKRFRVRKFFCLDMIGKLNFLPGVGFYIQSKTFANSIKQELRRGDYKDAIFYSRDTYPLVPVIQAKYRYFYEIHTTKINPGKLLLKVFEKSRGVVAINGNLAKQLEKYLLEDKIIVAHDGVDMEKFGVLITKQKARQALGMPGNKKIVLYMGHLYDWKGVHTLAHAAEYLDDNATVYIIGGTDKDTSKFKEFLEKFRLKKIKLLGRVSPSEVPLYLASADVFVLPNSAKKDISKYYTSPLKLFEYMASRRPVIASKIPSLLDVLDKSTAIFFTPDDPLDLSKKIKAVLAEEVPTERIVSNAFQEVQKYSWQARAKKILSFLNSKLNR